MFRFSRGPPARSSRIALREILAPDSPPSSTSASAPGQGRRAAPPPCPATSPGAARRRVDAGEVAALALGEQPPPDLLVDVLRLDELPRGRSPSRVTVCWSEYQ